ncbi:MAG: type IV secretion system DNA-binding domain-containing protein [Planctomycetes bacterium]|jgi:CxxC-x17-CxxC domain-containing protein|nr:type IV secretion system DNA-binding domain-containing protein [Planctomycetota bacterium]
MLNDEITIFAETTFRNRYRRFGIKIDDRRRHMYLIGKTGMGKSTIQENMIVEDIRAGKGVAVVDPHGDLAEKIIEYIPSQRVNDVIYFNPADIDYPIAFNVVEHVEPHLRHLVASGLIGVFQKLWADSWGPRLEYILRNAILAILDYPGSTLLAVTRMLSDKAFRKKVVEKIQDPVVKSFWVNEFAGYANNFASEAVSPIQNKVGQFLSSSLIRNIVGQVKSTIDMRKVMDEGKILILNLSKGRIGEDNSALLGSMMITKIQLAAMSRVEIPEPDRKDFYLYVDEFQNFATDSFANILSEARKYRLNLILAHQYIEQLSEQVAAAVFGNVGTLVVFRVGAADAEILEPEFMPIFTKEDIVNLPKYEFYLKLMIDGIASEPFSARGLPPLTEPEKTDNKEKAIKVSRERYAKDRPAVEEKITRWHENTEETDKRESKASIVGNRLAERSPAAASRPSASKPFLSTFAATVDERSAIHRPDPVYRYDAVCYRCGQATNTSFKPDGIRPIYCKECLSIARQEKKTEIETRRIAKKAELAALAVEEDKNPPPPAPEISLDEALKKSPIYFKKAAGSQPENRIPPPKKEMPSGVSAPKNPRRGENEINAGEEVIFK